LSLFRGFNRDGKTYSAANAVSEDARRCVRQSAIDSQENGRPLSFNTAQGKRRDVPRGTMRGGSFAQCLRIGIVLKRELRKAALRLFRFCLCLCPAPVMFAALG
jgi:hypothetical protein